MTDVFSKKLTVLIEDLGMTQKELAEETGILRSTLNLIVKGNRNPTWEQFNILLNYFKDKRDANYFFEQDVMQVGEPDKKYGFDEIQAIDSSIQNLQRLKKHLLERRNGAK